MVRQRLHLCWKFIVEAQEISALFTYITYTHISFWYIIASFFVVSALVRIEKALGEEGE